ncbi:MAG: HAMP domain-containing protein [Gammaproteobacteria bacterium]|nr:HAMP domain-containing protein [Gammaproteobacteria bacterium]
MSNGNIRWYSTIRSKIILVVTISCTIVLGGLSVYNMYNEQQVLSEDLARLAQVTSQRLSKHLIGPMWDLDSDLVDDTIEAEMLEDNIHAIVIWDAGTKQVFSARERGADGRLIESTGAIAGDLIQSSSKVNNGNKDIGEVAVFVSRKNLKKALAESTVSNIITLIVLIIVMAIIMTIVMSQIIIGPITRLAKHADDISHGDLKQTIKVESSDEIGQLAEAFHRMQTSLRVAFKRIYAKARAS